MLISTYIYNSKVAVCEAVDEQLNGGKKNQKQNKNKKRLNTKAVITYW